ncbi:MAG TPA: PTS sugar transporter subunit IIA [Candidatus Sulfotelmatobacter sp.]|nr:PTS sugar transporter subunit IIA [Candidatus Sulfotelmatobacter sp.]
MQLTLRQATEYLDVDEGTLRRWIKQRGLPVHVVNERMHLNAIELWEWATENGVPVSKRLLEQERRSPEAVPPLSAMLEAGGVHHDVEGRDRSSVLREMVRRLPLPPEVDREFLSAVIEAREAMGSTGIGDGIAIPHVRNPILLKVAEPRVTLCLLRHPIEFEAVDGRPVHALFTVISPTVPGHLRILAQLGFLLHDAELKSLLEARATAPRILARIRELEAAAPAGTRSRP